MIKLYHQFLHQPYWIIFNCLKSCRKLHALFYQSFRKIKWQISFSFQFHWLFRPMDSLMWISEDFFPCICFSLFWCIKHHEDFFKCRSFGCIRWQWWFYSHPSPRYCSLFSKNLMSELAVVEGKEIMQKRNLFISNLISKNENILKVDKIMRMLLPCLVFGSTKIYQTLLELFC